MTVKLRKAFTKSPYVTTLARLNLAEQVNHTIAIPTGISILLSKIHALEESDLQNSFRVLVIEIFAKVEFA